MSNLDKKEFAEAFSATCLAYEKAFSPELAKLYMLDLAEYSTESVKRAFSRHRKDPERGRFFPKVADIVYQIEGTQKQKSESVESSAELQWASIMRAAVNGSEPVNLELEARSALRSLGGISKVGYTLEKDIPFLKKDFIALYKSILSASSDQIADEIPLALEIRTKKTQVAIK